MFIFDRKLVLSALVFIFCVIANAQVSGVEIYGNIGDENTDLEGVQVKVSQAGRTLSSVNTDMNGDYAVKLPFGGEFLLEVSREGYVAKRFTVSTVGIPAEKQTDKFQPIGASINLLRRIEGVDYSILNQPMMKFRYNMVEETMEFDKTHQAMMSAEIKKIEEAQKELRRLEKEKEARFASLMKDGEKLLNKKDYPNAINAYQEALKIKPKEVYPQAQIENIRRLVSESEALAKRDAEARAKLDAEAKAKADADALAKKQADAAAEKLKAEAKLKADKDAADKLAKEKEAADAKAKLDAAAKAKAEADALAKKQADAAAEKLKAEAKLKADKEAADKLAKEKEAADAKAKLDAAAKAKAEADALAKKQADEAAEKLKAEAKLKADKEAADKLAKEKEAAAAKAKLDAAAKAKAEADALAKKQADDLAAAKLKAEEEQLAKKLAEEKLLSALKAEKELADKKAAAKAAEDQRLLAEALRKDKEASLLKKKQEDEERLRNEKLLADAVAKEKAAAAEKAKSTILPKLGDDSKYKEAIRKGDNFMALKRYAEAKKAFEEALIQKGNDPYAKEKLMECEKLMQSDAAVVTDERQRQLLSKYPPGVTEEMIPMDGLVIVKRVLVKERVAYVYEKKIFNWGGIAFFRDGSPITESLFEQETKK